MSKRIENLKSKIISSKIFLLKEYFFDYISNDKTEKQVREVYDHGDGSAVLLYNNIKKTIIVTRQFRLPTYLNGNDTGMSIEVCAGSLDQDNPAVCAKREVLEETGYKIDKVEKVFEVFVSPAVMTEIAHLFIAEYTDEMKINEGGGLVEEQEDIDVIEFDFEEALNMIKEGQIKDARTILLLQYLKLNKIIEK